ncbi:MAG: restriction endonuclease, partial [Deltaproteobacteria bacterium]|nr:restriction endonuclease [Deltaproteobacteria bacterium]
MSIARHHAEWLSLVETSGPFLSMPVLQRAFPQGLDEDPDKSETHALLRQAFTEWEESQEGSKPDPSIHREWVRFVLRRLLDFSDEVLAEGQALPPSLRVRFPEHGETLTPDIAVINPSGRPDAGKPRLLVSVVQSAQDLEKPLEGSRWKISAASRMIELLHAADVRLGLVTNGEHWMLVHAPRNETTGCASFYATIWLEEDITLRAFRSLLCQRRFFGVPDNDTPEALYAQSAEDQQEVTDQLGLQVRRAVEILVQCIDKLDRDSGRKLLSGFDEKVLYEAAVTTMMRLVFLLCAEERKLLPGESDIYTQHYAVSSLRTHLREAADRHGEEVLGFRYDMWSRLLAAFRAVHGGVGHESLRLPPYGGSLCDPDRFPFLEGRPQGSRWRDTAAQPLAIDNRTVLHLLEALQVLQVKVAGGGPAEARRLSFKALGIEQIGHVYEGLLDHTAKRASEPVLGLSGAKGQEPEISLASIESQKAKGTDALVEFLADETGRSKSALKRAVENPTLETEGALFAACGSDEKLVGRVRPFTALIRNDSMGYPVVIAEGSVFVTAGEDRRSTGTHYTPTSLTEPIVQHTLEPLVYDGPAEGKPREEWKLRSTKALLDLKVCDLAMGSGAFLVQTCRYLAERLVEAWDVLEREGGNLRITPEGEVAKGGATERIIPKSVEERLILAQRIVADRCLYGVDKNHMAVEMAKLSLWLVTMDKGKPFTFLDHALKGGDSLLGVDKEQLETWSLERGKKLKALDAFASKEIKNAIFARKKLEWISDDDIRAVEEKARIHREVERSLEKLKVAGDLIIATAFSSGSDIEPALEHSQAKFTAYQFAGGDDLIRQMAADAHRALGRHRPFHWPLEFPEVFLDEKRGGFDAIISNPPFQGGQKITGALGTEYRNYLVNHLAGGQRGSADLCAYFYLRANQLLRPWGQFGMLATNTIAQGDTREVGLEQITRDGGVITRAIPSMKWPGVANLEVAIVWVTKGKWYGQHLLGDLAADHITEYLTTKGATAGKPFRLKANENKSFQGSIVLGMGFILTPEEAQALIKKDKRNREVLFPYLNGEDLNSRPDQSPSRWVINFFDWSIEKAKEYRDCFKIVE